MGQYSTFRFCNDIVNPGEFILDILRIIFKIGHNLSNERKEFIFNNLPDHEFFKMKSNYNDNIIPWKSFFSGLIELESRLLVPDVSESYYKIDFEISFKYGYCGGIDIDVIEEFISFLSQYMTVTDEQGCAPKKVGWYTQEGWYHDYVRDIFINKGRKITYSEWYVEGL